MPVDVSVTDAVVDGAVVFPSVGSEKKRQLLRALDEDQRFVSKFVNAEISERLIRTEFHGSYYSELKCSAHYSISVNYLTQVLIEPNEPITDSYFPYDAITSTVQDMSDGDSVETVYSRRLFLRRDLTFAPTPIRPVVSNTIVMGSGISSGF